MFPEVRHGIPRLGVGIIAVPLTGFLAGLVKIARLVVVVRTLESLPVVEALPAFRWDVGGAARAIDMPLADIARVVACLAQGLCERGGLCVEAQIVQKKPMGERILAGQEAGTVRAANRNARYGVSKVYALVGKEVDVGRPHIRIAHVAVVHGPPLVRKQVNYIGLLCLGFFLGGALGRGREGGGRGSEEVAAIHLGDSCKGWSRAGQRSLLNTGSAGPSDPTRFSPSRRGPTAAGAADARIV